VAQAFDFAGISNAVGAPLLRSLQGRESGMHASRAFDRATQQITWHTQHRRPPLQKTQGWGTLIRKGSGQSRNLLRKLGQDCIDASNNLFRFARHRHPCASRFASARSSDLARQTQASESQDK